MLRLPTLTLTLFLAAAAPAAAQSVPWRVAPDIALGKPQALTVGDFNSDGRQDLAIADEKDQCIHIRLGNGDGTFSDGGKVVGTTVRPKDLAVGDFNADGNEDLLVGALTTGSADLAYARGAGDGKFTIGNGFDFTDIVRSLAVVDLDPDGRSDVATATGDEVRVRAGLDSGTSVTRRFSAGGPTRALAGGDFDGDGLEDLAVLLEGTTPAISIMPGAGGGGFRDAIPTPLAHAGSSLAVGDLDGDARDDIVVAIPGRNQVVVRRGSGAGAADVAVGGQPEAIAIADLDADGLDDLLTANATGGTVSVRLGNGDGSFRPGGEVAIGTTPVDLAVADFDADGRQDVVVANQGGTVAVRLGAGPAPLEGNLLANGGFEQGQAARVPQEAPTIPGWTTTGGMTFVRYGTSPHFGTPTWLDAPRYGGGRHFLWGGDSTGHAGVTETSQTVSVLDAAEGIDSGRAVAGLSAYLGGGLAFPDNMTATAEFLDADGAARGVLRIGPVTSEDRRNVTTMQRRAGSAAVPARTRRVRVTLTSRDTDRWSSAMADNVKLTVSVRPQDPPQPPPAGRPAFGTRTRVTIGLAAKRLPLRVRVVNANDFPVTGVLRAKRFTVAAGGRTTVRLPKPQRLRRLRVVAVVTDPAGNRRTIARRVTVRRR